MNGLVPYVDFADSKGPLLWLIYGVGYLLNSHSYVGVFWMSCVFYAVSFTFAYKLSRLYLDRRGSVLVLALLPSVLFLKGIHNEVRAEDFCNTFIFIALYSLCCIIKGRTDKRRLFKYAFAVGASMTCCLLIKWNYFFMIGGMALVVLYVSIKKNTLSGLWGGLAGIAAPAIPFLAYFLIQGNFEAFITEYFINCMICVDNFAIHDLSVTARYSLKLKLLFLIGVCLFCYKRKGNWGILFSLLVFIGLLLPYSGRYYYSVITPFSLFLFIVTVEYAEKRITVSRSMAVTFSFLCIIGSIAYNGIDNIIHRSVFIYNKNRQPSYDLSQLMATVKNPKVIVIVSDPISALEYGVGVLADALPACKYWVLQNGHTDAMAKEQQSDLRKRKADFVVSPSLDEYKRNKSLEAELNRLGYVYCGDCYGGNSMQPVYCKKELYRKLPPVKLRTIDLLLKRDILSGAAGAK